jgi:DNA-binding IclR family transcriptional regulator
VHHAAHRSSTVSPISLERDDEGRFRIGLRIWELGADVATGLGLREAALPSMDDLYEVTHETVRLAVCDDDELVFAARDADTA